MGDFFATFSSSSSGWQFMWIILIFFVAMIAISIERLIYVFGKANINAGRFMAEIRKLVAAGDFKKAIALCKSGSEKALPQVIIAALVEAEKREFVDFRTVQNAVDEASLSVIPKLGKRTGWLAVLSNVATLTGLLGTIFGLVVAFKAVGDPKVAAAGGGTTMLAQGIAIAMFTTLWGLIVAIPGLLVYTVVNNKTQAILDDIDEHSVKLIHLLTGGK
ncbi:MAG: MotA/TolQ/ExbB proton channel family protein [Calditrichota bacterium]